MNFAKFLNQTATRWEFSGNDGYGGASYASSPEEITCRWSDHISTFVNMKGEEELAGTTVLTESEIAVDDWLYLGDVSGVLSEHLADGTYYANGAIYADGVSDTYDSPENIAGAFRVKQVAKIVTIKADQTLYKVFLSTKRM